MRRWPVKRIDLSWSHWFLALSHCLLPGNRQVLLEEICTSTGSAVEPLVCVSTRAAFDLLLRAVDWEDGDEILFSGLTIAAMPELAISHGFRILPLDIDPDSGVPNHRELTRMVTPRTRAIVVAHLFGARFDLTDLIEEAKKHNLLVVEDCAQAYDGPNWHGHTTADISLFSFGSTKSATALGGAIAFVRNARLRKTMETLHLALPLQSRISYFRRLVKYGLVMACTFPGIYRVLSFLAKKVGLQMEHLIHTVSRSPSAGTTMDHLRTQPSNPLLRLLCARLEEGTSRLEFRRSRAQILLSSVKNKQLIPTSEHKHHNYWIVPFRADLANLTKLDLSNAGLDVISSRLVPVDALPECSGAHQLASIVLLPFDPAMSDGLLAEIGRTINQLTDTPQPHASALSQQQTSSTS